MQHRTTVQITFGLKTYKCIFVLQTGQISGFPLLHAHHLAFAHSCIIQRHIHHPYVWLLICKAQTECGNGSDQMNRYQCHKGIALKLIKNTSQRFLDKSCDRVCVRPAHHSLSSWPQCFWPCRCTLCFPLSELSPGLDSPGRSASQASYLSRSRSLLSASSEDSHRIFIPETVRVSTQPGLPPET